MGLELSLIFERLDLAFKFISLRCKHLDVDSLLLVFLGQLLDDQLVVVDLSLTLCHHRLVLFLFLGLLSVDIGELVGLVFDLDSLGMVDLSLARNLLKGLGVLILGLFELLVGLSELLLALRQLHFNVAQRFPQLLGVDVGQPQHLLVLIFSALLAVNAEPLSSAGAQGAGALARHL